MHISYNIPELQNAFYDICRVRVFERNKKRCSSFKIVGFIIYFIRIKIVFRISKLSEEIGVWPNVYIVIIRLSIAYSRAHN